MSNNAIHQANPLCLSCRNHGACEDEFAGAGAADQFGKQPAAAPIWMQADARKARSERSSVRSNANIASERKTEARSGTGAVDCGDDSLGQRPHRLGNLLACRQNLSKS